MSARRASNWATMARSSSFSLWRPPAYAIQPGPRPRSEGIWRAEITGLTVGSVEASIAIVPRHSSYSSASFWRSTKVPSMLSIRLERSPAPATWILTASSAMAFMRFSSRAASPALSISPRMKRCMSVLAVVVL
jgi:hypothetical protein